MCESAESAKKIPYDLVSSFVILRDYADLDDAYINDEHRALVDIADSIYNISPSIIKQFKGAYKEIYDKYGSSYFNKVIKDVRALDSQVSHENINDLIAEVNDKLSAF